MILDHLYPDILIQREGLPTLVSGTDIEFRVIVGHYRSGCAPEWIGAIYPVIPLWKIYVILAYYIKNEKILNMVLWRDMNT